MTRISAGIPIASWRFHLNLVGQTLSRLALFFSFDAVEAMKQSSLPKHRGNFEGRITSMEIVKFTEAKLKRNATMFAPKAIAKELKGGMMYSLFNNLKASHNLADDFFIVAGDVGGSRQ
ncbi:hypothetical protein KSS87_011483 [Heliosperma pusillum]|nr:hypothetical protein KSS87_011483 [Heliosperma pusillum]